MSAAHYDENLLVEMLADDAPYAKIAQAVGLTASMVGKIARGSYRVNLSRRVEEILETRRQAVCDTAARRAADLMRAHVEEGLKAGGETARKCREFILERIIAQGDCDNDVLDTLLADSAKPTQPPADADAPAPAAPAPTAPACRLAT